MNEIELWQKIRDEAHERYIFASTKLEEAIRAADAEREADDKTNVVKLRTVR